ncbi:hypothetical protein OGATHE_006542 [Ogataea polymorpha]|uniref:Uncharacterized protein n=1 Tax=Ogataea polymorpha TaxID=460523 RepID=A0A9P8SXL8_9ASCO|nr:hypothetical protein OGATHE_006542 [Ogataea polymorpha]
MRLTNSNAFGDVFFGSVLVMESNDENALTLDFEVVVTPTTVDVVGDEALKVLRSGGSSPLRTPALTALTGCLMRETVFLGRAAIVLIPKSSPSYSSIASCTEAAPENTSSLTLMALRSFSMTPIIWSS